MFGSNIPETVYSKDEVEPELKRKKLDRACEIKSIHSSLTYSSIKAPPLVAYKSIDSYCENKRWESALNAPSTSGLNDIQSVSSPIVLKTPKVEPVKKVLTEDPMPYTLLSIEELSLVKCLKNWTSTKVCVIGQVSLDTSTQIYHLSSVREQGQCALMLDILSLEEPPKLQELLQVFGTLVINDVQCCLNVFFTRNISRLNLSLLTDSYRLMEMQVGMIEYQMYYENNQVESVKKTEIIREPQMNDTLNDYSFSSLL